MRVAGRDGGEGSASPGSVATDDITPTPPSPCLHELGDDDATPRQQWSPTGMQSLVRAKTHSDGASTFTGVRSGGGGTSRSSSASSASSSSSSNSCGAEHRKGGGGERAAGTFGNITAPTPVSATAGGSLPVGSSAGCRPDSPVMRVDLERLDLSVLALGEERSGSGPGAGDMNPDTFSSEPGGGRVGVGGRPRSLGGRPSRTHALFVTPGHFVTGPSSPPSSYSTHSESGFTSPTRRVASPGFPREQGRVRKGHWKKGKPIGVGSCGNVYLGMNEQTGELMAVKEITLEAKERLLCSLYNEIQVMHKLVHPHIVGYLGAELQDSQRKLCIFQEWVPAGSLHSLLDQFGSLSDAMTRKYTGQVLEGLAYLHANRVIHRDVKSKNILVDDRGNVKLADFGCALVLKDDNHGGDGVEMSMKGTPLFMAPEMLLKRKCGRRVDVWSLGCAVLEMVTTRPPWADAFKHPVEIIAHFNENPGPPPLPNDLAPGLRHFLLSCFTWDAELRPSANELLGHQYLQVRAGPPMADGSPGEDVPLEEMDRVSAVTRMRRCSSATLDLLAVQARQAALGVSIGGALAAFGTAPSGTFRPPSPRYGPGGAGVHSKRTPTRRRMYTEAGLPPPESLAPGIASAKAMTVSCSPAVGPNPSAELTRRFSMPAAHSPPVSPEKPRRPGRGCSGSFTLEEEGRVSLGPVYPARLRSLGRGVDRSSSNRSIGSGDSSGCGGSGSGGDGRQADSGSASSVSPNTEEGVSASSGGAAPTNGGVAHKAAPVPTMPPLVREVLAVTVEDVRTGGGGSDLGPVGDTPPPTVRPLEPGRAVPGRPGETSWPSTVQDAGVHALLQPPRRVGVADPKGMWAAGGVMSDARGSLGSRY